MGLGTEEWAQKIGPLVFGDLHMSLLGIGGKASFTSVQKGPTLGLML